MSRPLHGTRWTVTRIERCTDVADCLALKECAQLEGYRFLGRLIDGWNDGSNRFDREGELLLMARHGDTAVGVGGVNAQAPGVGRLRRVYVHPDARGAGIGHALVTALLRHARDHFDQIVLRTDNPVAARLYERMGFVPADPDGPLRATHLLSLRADA